MNTESPSAEESPFSLSDQTCYANHGQCASLKLITDDGLSHLLAYAQFLRSERGPNPDLERLPDAPPERLRLWFASAEVLIVGSGLNTIEGGLQKSVLQFVKAVDLRFAATLATHVASVTLTLNSERS